MSDAPGTDYQELFKYAVLIIGNLVAVIVYLWKKLQKVTDAWLKRELERADHERGVSSKLQNLSGDE